MEFEFDVSNVNDNVANTILLANQQLPEGTSIFINKETGEIVCQGTYDHSTFDRFVSTMEYYKTNPGHYLVYKTKKLLNSD